jgi:hypothetical protein
MKGIEENLSQTIFLIGAILAAVILIYMASLYLSGLGKDNSTELAGDKQQALSEIRTIAVDCWAKYSGRKTADVCSTLYLNESENIYSDELISYLKGSKIPVSSIRAENISGPSDIAITYRDNLIFIEGR